jgi:hypothetical protein
MAASTLLLWPQQTFWGLVTPQGVILMIMMPLDYLSLD